MRIVHIITRFVSGGADENTALTCNRQAEMGHEVWLVHGAAFSERMLEMTDERVKVVPLPTLVREVDPLRDIRALGALAKIFRRIRPDIVHTHTSKAGIVGRMAALCVPSAKVIHGVHILPFTGERWPKRFLYVVLEKAAALRTDAFIDVSEGMRDLCLAYALGSEANHHVIFSGMDVEGFRHAAPADDLQALRTGEDEVLIGYVAVLERRKRHRELVQSLIPVLRAHPHAHLVLAGEGPERPVLESMISQAGLERQVHLCGFRNDIANAIAACDLCVFGSEREGLPRSLVQYALAGKPIVATHLPGIERIVREGENGYVVSEQDFAAFSQKVDNLVSDAARRDAFARASAALDLSEWDARTMVDRIQDVYAGVSTSGGGPRRGGRAAVGNVHDLPPQP